MDLRTRYWEYDLLTHNGQKKSIENSNDTTMVYLDVTHGKEDQHKGDASIVLSCLPTFPAYCASRPPYTNTSTYARLRGVVSSRVSHLSYELPALTQEVPFWLCELQAEKSKM